MNYTTVINIFNIYDRKKLELTYRFFKDCSRLSKNNQIHSNNVHVLEGGASRVGRPVQISRCWAHKLSEQEITARLREGENVYQNIKHLVWDNTYTKEGKSYHVQGLFYSNSCETWNITKKKQSRVQASSMRFIRAIKAKMNWDRIRNEWLRIQIVEYSIREKCIKNYDDFVMRTEWRMIEYYKFH